MINKKPIKGGPSMNFKIGELDDDIYLNSTFMSFEAIYKKVDVTIEVKDIKNKSNGKSKSKLF